VHSFTIALGVLALVCGGLAIVFAHFPPAWVFLFQGIVIVGAVLFERYRYKPIEASVPPGNWQRTSERFLDEHGRPVTVWLDPDTGERKYVQD
jgi:hypothetical protein